MNIKRIYLIIGAALVAVVALVLLLADTKPEADAAAGAAPGLPPGHPDIGDMRQSPAEGGPNKANVKPEFYEELERLRAKVDAAPRGDTSDLLALAQMLYFSHKHEDALVYYERFHRAAPKHIDAMFDLTLVYFDLNRYEDAARMTRGILALEPANSKAMYNLGTIYAAQDKKDEARGIWRKLIELAPRSDDAARAEEMLKKL